MTLRHQYSLRWKSRPWMSLWYLVITQAMGTNTDPSCSRARDPHMALASSTDPDITWPTCRLGHPCQPVPHHLCISSFPSLHSAQNTPLLLSHFPTTQLFIVALPAGGTGHWAGLGLSSVGLGLDRFFLITPLSNVFSLSAGHSFSFFRASLRELKRVCKVLILIRLNNSVCFPRL